jgi:hypothetical protein
MNLLEGLCSSTVQIPGVCNVAFNESIFAGNCWPMASTDTEYFPDLHITLETAGTFTLPASNYLFPVDSGSTTYYCLGISSGTLQTAWIMDYRSSKLQF